MVFETIIDQVLGEILRQIHVVVNVIKGNLWFNHPKFSQVAWCIGVFSPKSRPESVNFSQGQGGNFALQLARMKERARLLVMFFSHCSYACPRITADLKKIEQRLSPDERARVGFVMASFDSERDVPATLKTFAATKELDLARWVLLHGDEDQVRELAAVLNVRYRRDENGDIDHSNLITLLDEKGRIVFQREGLEGDPDVVVKAVRELLAKAEETHP